MNNVTSFAEKLYEKLSPRISTMTDTEVLDTLKMAREQKSDRHLVMALHAEAFSRGLLD